MFGIEHPNDPNTQVDRGEIKWFGRLTSYRYRTLDKQEILSFENIFNRIAPLGVDGYPLHCVSRILRNKKEFVKIGAGIIKDRFTRRFSDHPMHPEFTMDLLTPADIGLDDYVSTPLIEHVMDKTTSSLLLGIAVPKSYLPVKGFCQITYAGMKHPPISLDALNFMSAGSRLEDTWVAMEIEPLFILAESEVTFFTNMRCNIPDDLLPDIMLEKITNNDTKGIHPRYIGVSYFNEVYKRGV